MAHNIRTSSEHTSSIAEAHTSTLEASEQTSSPASHTAHNRDHERPTYQHPLRIMSGLYLGVFAGLYSETSLNIALSKLSEHFAVSLALMQWIVVGYMLVIGIILPFTSLLMKRIPARRLVLFALSAFIVGAILSALAPSFALLLAGRMIQGVGTGLILPVVFAATVKVFPPYRVGTAMGIASLIILFAPVIGPTLAGFLIAAFSWRAIFWSFALIVALAWICAFAFMVEPFERTTHRLDILSCIPAILGFGGIVLGTSLAAEFGFGSLSVLISLLVGILGVVLFVRRQCHLETPVLDMRVFSHGAFTVGSLMVTLSFATILAVMYVFPQYLQNAQGIDVAKAGLLLLPGGLVNALVAMGAGILMDRIGARIITRTGYLLSLAGVALMLVAVTRGSLPLLMTGYMVMSLGVPCTMSPSQTYALGALPGNLSTDGSTIVNTSQQVMGAVATAVATTLLLNGTRLAQGSGATSAQAFASGSAWVFIFALVLLVCAFAISLKVAQLPSAEEAHQKLQA